MKTDKEKEKFLVEEFLLMMMASLVQEVYKDKSLTAPDKIKCISETADFFRKLNVDHY